MREITIGEKQVRVRATPLALLYYKQEFRSDLVSDIVKMQNINKDPSQFDSVIIMQVTWTMSKADAGPGAQFPSFKKWVSELDCFDVSDQEMMQAVMDEAADGFFRRGRQAKQRGGK